MGKQRNFFKLMLQKQARVEKAKAITAIAKQSDSNNHPQTRSSHSQQSYPPNSQ